MSRTGGIWAVVPVKEFAAAKQRLSGLLSSEQRRTLAAAMLADVLAVLAEVGELAGILVVTCDPVARDLAADAGARTTSEDSRAGQTVAVRSAARLLAREEAGGMLVIPGDVPLICVEEVNELLAAHRPAPAFTIAPAHDRRGSNAVLCSPPEFVRLHFGEDSFVPHLAAARRAGIEPTTVSAPGIALDIDRPEDLARVARMGPSRQTRTHAWIEAAGLATTIGTKFTASFVR